MWPCWQWPAHARARAQKKRSGRRRRRTASAPIPLPTTKKTHRSRRTGTPRRAQTPAEGRRRALALGVLSERVCVCGRGVRANETSGEEKEVRERWRRGEQRVSLSTASPTSCCPRPLLGPHAPRRPPCPPVEDRQVRMPSSLADFGTPIARRPGRPASLARAHRSSPIRRRALLRSPRPRFPHTKPCPARPPSSPSRRPCTKPRPRPGAMGWRPRPPRPRTPGSRRRPARRRRMRRALWAAS